MECSRCCTQRIIVTLTKDYPSSFANQCFKSADNGGKDWPQTGRFVSKRRIVPTKIFHNKHPAAKRHICHQAKAQASTKTFGWWCLDSPAHVHDARGMGCKSTYMMLLYACVRGDSIMYMSCDSNACFPRYYTQIYVRTLCGRQFVIMVSPYDTIDAVRMKIRMKEGISEDQQRLLFKGRQLEEGTCLEWDLYDSCTICLTLRLRGG